MRPFTPEDQGSNLESWEISWAASYLTNQACTVSDKHLQDGILRLQFNREVADYVALIVNDYKQGKTTPDRTLRLLKDEQTSLINQSMELTQKGIGVIAGIAQIASGASVCYASAGTLCAFFGVPLIAHGSSNIYENGRNFIEGRSDTQGPVRQAYHAASSAMGGGEREANLAYGAIDLSISAYGLGRMMLKPDSWRLFRYIRSDYVRAYSKLGKGALTLEALSNGLTMNALRQEFEKRDKQ